MNDLIESLCVVKERLFMFRSQISHATFPREIGFECCCAGHTRNITRRASCFLDGPARMFLLQSTSNAHGVAFTALPCTSLEQHDGSPLALCLPTLGHAPWSSLVQLPRSSTRGTFPRSLVMATHAWLVHGLCFSWPLIDR